MNGKINENQVLNFKRDVVSFLSKICTYLAEKSPIKLSLPRNCRCFIPSLLVENSESSKARFIYVPENLAIAQQITDEFAGEAKQHFPKFLEIAKENKQSFAEFDLQKEGHHLDTFYWNHIEGVSSVEKVAEVLKMILTLSHGQASVERGFSINKSLLVENLSETSLISQKIVLDHLRFKMSAQKILKCLESYAKA